MAVLPTEDTKIVMPERKKQISPPHSLGIKRIHRHSEIKDPVLKIRLKRGPNLSPNIGRRYIA